MVITMNKLSECLVSYYVHEKKEGKNDTYRSHQPLVLHIWLLFLYNCVMFHNSLSTSQNGHTCCLCTGHANIQSTGSPGITTLLIRGTNLNATNHGSDC